MLKPETLQHPNETITSEFGAVDILINAAGGNHPSATTNPDLSFFDLPLGVLAHSPHVRGSGVMEAGVEKPNVRVTLASKISAEDCARLNLGYLDPSKVNVDEWKNREDEGILYVPKAGEILYRLKI